MMEKETTSRHVFCYLLPLSIIIQPLIHRYHTGCRLWPSIQANLKGFMMDVFRRSIKVDFFAAAGVTATSICCEDWEIGDEAVAKLFSITGLPDASDVSMLCMA